MGRALHFLATRFLRSRAGIGLLLAMLVLGIVGAARVLSGPGDPGITGHAPPPPLVVTPTTPDDGLLSPGVTASPTSIPGAEAPEAVAISFANGWVAHLDVSAEDWHSRLVPYATDKLAQELAGVDPEVVPADRVTGNPAVIPHAATIVEVTIPVDSGKLRLRLLGTDGRWLVDGVDWERA